METVSRWLLTFLLNALWQIPAVALVAALAARLLRRGPAAHRHAVWVAALVAAILLPLTSVRTAEPAPPLQVTASYTPAPAADLFTLAPSPAHAAPARPAPVSNARIVPFARTTATVLLAAYLLFLLYRLGKLAAAWRTTAQIRRSARASSATPLVEKVWRQCLEAFGLRDVSLLSSSSLSSPVTAGAWRKTVILPDSLFTGTSEDLLATAIGHEMAHLARRDFAWNLLCEALYLPVAFHPAARLMHRAIEQTREMACDELVTRRLLEPQVYARSIISIAAMATPTQPGYTLGVFDGDILEERIRRLLERPAANLKRARLLLASGLAALGACVVIASGLALTARAQSGFHPEMKLAGDAYNRGDFQTAIQHFDNAVKLDPNNVNARLFLAHTLIRQLTAQKGQPAGDLVARARQQYQDVLALDAGNKVALQGMMVAAMDAGQFSEARDWVLKLIQADPKEKGAYYTAGALDWASVFPEFQRAKQAAGAKPQDYSIPDAVVRKSLRDQFLPRIEDGFRMLQIALDLDPNYADAMAYLNLLDRLKAGLVDSPAESAELIAQADAWVGKAIAAKRRNAQNPPQPPAPLDVDGPPPGPASARASFAAPPPPPPPPPPAWVSGRQPASAAPLLRRRNAAELPGTFWQVAGGDKMPANDLIQMLQAKGFQARLVWAAEDHAVYVMAGPYSDAPSLEKARAALEAAGLHPLRTW